MKTPITVLCALSLLATPAFAQDKKDDAKRERSPVHKRQVERINECNLKAKDRTGGERKRFMTSCLKANADDPKLATQQKRTKECAQEAADKGLQGDARMKFMGSCLKG